MKKFYNFVFAIVISSSFFTNMAGDAPFFFVTTVPKSGTHLINKVLMHITGKELGWNTETTIEQSSIDHFSNANFFYLAHAPCVGNNFEIIKKNKLKVILLLRDPRDVLVSYAYW